MSTAIATVVRSIAPKNVIRFSASKIAFSTSSPITVRSHGVRGPRSASGSATSPITAKMIGDVTHDDRSVGRRNRLHVPHDAAAIVTIARPLAIEGDRGGEVTRGIVQRVTEHERFLRAFHDARPGITARALERAGSYDRLAARCTGRVLDLACGDGPLLARVPGAVGLDLSPAELAAARARVPGAIVVEGRAQALPFSPASFDTVACHLAFMLLDDVERVVAELDRVLAPGGRFVAVLGGGPTADGHDAFHDFLARLPKGGRRFGDPRARSEAGWRALFAGWSEPVFERWELELSGRFEDVWTFLGASYELTPTDAARLHDELAPRYPAVAPCRVVTFCAEVRR